MAAEPKLDIPILIDAVGRGYLEERLRDHAPALSARSVDQSLGPERETLIAELQTEIAAGIFALTDEIMRETFAEMEAAVFEQVCARLRSELPEMIDALLRARLANRNDY
jgi:hypothetical protein